MPLYFISSLICSAALAVVYSAALLLTLGIVVLYMAVNLGVSIDLAMRKKALRYLFTLPIVFTVRHVAHGLGALFGLLLVLMPGQIWHGRRGREA